MVLFKAFHMWIVTFNPLLGGVRESRRTVIPTVVVYCSEVIQMKISEGPKCIEKNLGKVSHDLPVLFSSTDRMYDNVHGVLSSRETPLSLGAQFLGTLVRMTCFSFFNLLPHTSD